MNIMKLGTIHHPRYKEELNKMLKGDIDDILMRQARAKTENHDQACALYLILKLDNKIH